MYRAALIAVGLAIVPLVLVAQPGPLTIVVCAPGYPGNTEAAQPVMDDFAKAVAGTGGWSAESVRAVYHQTLDEGLAQLEDRSSTVAIVSVPFYLEFRDRLDLQPILAVEPAAGPKEQWSLVARTGSVSGAASLDGYRLVGMAGFAPKFVRRIALADWEVLPDGVEIGFASRVLSELRKASRGEPTAVLLDFGQAAALPALPFADDLEVIVRSKPHIASVVCAVGGRLPDESRTALVDALLGLGEHESGKEILESMRIATFGTLDLEELAPLERAYDAE